MTYPNDTPQQFCPEQESKIQQLHTLAEQGDADAQFNLGISYELGDGVDQDDEFCLYWYRKAADRAGTWRCAVHPWLLLSQWHHRRGRR